MRNRIRQRMLRRIALAFAVAAIVAPTAQAVPLEPGATNAVQAGEYGMPTAMPSDYAANRGDRIELARLQDRGTDTSLRGLDGIENVRVEPRGGERPVLVADFPRGNTAPHGNQVEAGEYGMPTAMPSDYAANRGDRIELARLQDRTGSDLRAGDRVENVRVEPRGLDQPVLVVNDSSFNWSDAGIGAGLAFAAILLAGAAALGVRQHGRLGQV
jgi:hypothetical protein